MNNIGLISITHDPQGNNIELVKKYAALLKNIYNEMLIAVSDKTDKGLIDELSRNDFRIKIIPKKGVAQARREVLKLGLSSLNQYFHYCDFDRLLTWVDAYEDELRKTVNEIVKYDYLILGRTERAFSTHPIEWRETEKISNKIFSLELGQEVDVTAGSCGISRNCAQLIEMNSKDKMTDAEWPMIAHRIGKMKIGYKPVEGLKYRDDINGTIARISDSEKWFVRAKLCYMISESAINAGKNIEYK